MNVASQFFLALKEKRFAKRKLRELLDAYEAVSAQRPHLAGIDLYRAVLLHTKQVEASEVDEILSEAEDSVDEWTSPGRTAMGLREVAHFFVTSQYIDSGHTGAIVSFRELVDALIPADL